MSGVSTGIMDERIFTGQWLRKTTEPEKALEMCHQDGHLLIWYQLDLSSVEPLQEAHVKRALDHLYRKVPSLCVGLGNHEGEMWFRKATNPNVDFKVCRGMKLEEVRESLRTYHYKSDTGPLFCARLLQDSPDTIDNPGVQEPSLPNKSHILFGFHHAITDGTSNMMLMGFFISLLNDVISDKPINDEETLGTFASPQETLRLINEKKKLLEVDPALKKKIADDIQFRKDHIPLVIKGLPAPKEKRKAASLVRVLDQDTTTRFIQRCKQNKVTVNSVFTSLVNMAIVDVLIEHGVIQESYIVQNFHAVNYRRYWETKPSKPLGMHMGYPLTMYTKTPKDVHDTFWDYAKEVGESLKHEILSGRLLSDEAYEIMTSENKSHSETNSDAGKTYAGDYITSSMGDITPIVTEGGDNVRITNLCRGSTFQLTEYTMLVNSHTFRGIFTIILDYNVGLVQTAIAEKICSQIVKRLLEITE